MVLLAEVVMGAVVEIVDVAPQIPPDEREPRNILVCFAVELLHVPQSVCVKDLATANICSMLVTRDTSHLEMSQLNASAEWNMPTMLVTLDTFHLEMSTLNASAAENIPSMLATLDTSHLEMSPLNREA